MIGALRRAVGIRWEDTHAEDRCSRTWTLAGTELFRSTLCKAQGVRVCRVARPTLCVCGHQIGRHLFEYQTESWFGCQECLMCPSHERFYPMAAEVAYPGVKTATDEAVWLGFWTVIVGLTMGAVFMWYGSHSLAGVRRTPSGDARERDGGIRR